VGKGSFGINALTPRASFPIDSVTNSPNCDSTVIAPCFFTKAYLKLLHVIYGWLHGGMSIGHVEDAGHGQ
jgi:hypothetical protein